MPAPNEVVDQERPERTRDVIFRTELDAEGNLVRRAVGQRSRDREIDGRIVPGDLTPYQRRIAELQEERRRRGGPGRTEPGPGRIPTDSQRVDEELRRRDARRSAEGRQGGGGADAARQEEIRRNNRRAAGRPSRSPSSGRRGRGGIRGAAGRLARAGADRAAARRQRRGRR